MNYYFFVAFYFFFTIIIEKELDSSFELHSFMQLFLLFHHK